MVDSYFNRKYGGAMDPYGSWQLEAYKMGPSTNPKADQLKEFQLDANWGTKNIEVGWLGKKELETFPKPAVDELRRLGKLTGTRASVHGPMEDPAGFDELKNEQKEHARRAVVHEYEHAMDVAHYAGGDNTPVVFHASNKYPGKIYSMNGKEEPESMGVMDRESGKFVAIVEKEKKKTREGEVEWFPKDQIDMLNLSDWQNNIRDMTEARKNIAETEEILNNKIKKTSSYQSKSDLEWGTGLVNSMKSKINANILSAYHNFEKFLPEADKIKDPKEREKTTKKIKILNGIKNDCLNEHKQIWKEYIDIYNQEIDAAAKNNRPLIDQLNLKRHNLLMKDIDNWEYFFGSTLDYGVIPEKFAPVEEVTRKPAAKTFAQTAFNAYNKYGDKAPIVMIENPPPPQAFSRADEHKKIVDQARDQLVEISKQKGKPISRQKAKKLIQATLDTAHYGLWKQYGYSDEDLKDMAKKIAPIAGHLHISDNFGSSDSHLPPGWGSLPNEEIVKILQDKGFKGRTVLEVGGAESLGYHPYLQSLEQFNSGIYSWAAKPSWSDVGDYFFGSSMYNAPGTSLPPVHQQEYGSGFSSLPPMSGVGKKNKSSASGTPYS